VTLIRAFVRRDFRQEKTYRLALITQFAGIFSTLLSAGFLSRLVPGNTTALRPYGGDYFTFALVGTAALSYFSVALGSFAGSLGQEQQMGTMEALLVTPNDPKLLLVCGAAWPFIFATVQLVLYIALGALLFHAKIALGNLAIASGMLLLTLAAFSAVGLAAAGLIMVVKRTGALLGFVGSAFGLLGGVLYPISVLPRPFQLLAYALPMSHGLEGVRLALVPNPDLGAIGRDALALGLFTVVLVPVAFWGFEWSVRQCRRTGSLGHY
jgi:ABC-2 type transport system permease protein